MSIVSSNQRVIFSNYDITATGYVYNETASKGSEAGWQFAKVTDCIVQIGVGTLTRPVYYRVEGRFSDEDRAASISVGNISGTNIDKFINISDFKTPYIRVGAGIATAISSTGGAGTHNLYCKLILTDRR